METYDHLWKELLESLETEVLKKIFKVTKPDSKRRCPIKPIMISSVVKNTLSSKELLSRTALTKNILYKFALVRRMSVNISQTRDKIAQEILKYWNTQGLPGYRLRDHEQRECGKILVRLEESTIVEIWKKVKTCHERNSTLSLLDDIVKSLPSVEWLLQRRCITREMLVSYLVSENNTIDGQPSKDELVRAVLHNISQYNL